jgi:hypothetical protein
MRVMVQLWISAVGGPPALQIAAKYVNDTVLNLFRDSDEIHEIATSSRAFNLQLHEEPGSRSFPWAIYLQIVPIVLIKAL